MSLTSSRQVERFLPPLLIGLGLTLAAATLAGCGSDDEGVATGAASDVVATTEVVDDTRSGAGDASSTTDGTGDEASPPSDDEAGDGTDGGGGDGEPMDEGELPGDGFEGFAREGDELTVVGVAHDDVLNVRRGPGTDFPVVAELAPVGDTVTATGRARLLARSLWYEIEVGPVTGWVNAGFLAYPGAVDDVTVTVMDALDTADSGAGGETMVDLGRAVAATQASSDVESRIVLSVAPEVGDLGEVTYDVIGLADDAVLGYRLHVFATPAAGGEGFDLRTVEQTVLCSRGVDAEGRCA